MEKLISNQQSLLNKYAQQQQLGKSNEERKEIDQCIKKKLDESMKIVNELCKIYANIQNQLQIAIDQRNIFEKPKSLNSLDACRNSLERFHKKIKDNINKTQFPVKSKARRSKERRSRTKKQSKSSQRQSKKRSKGSREKEEKRFREKISPVKLITIETGNANQPGVNTSLLRTKNKKRNKTLATIIPPTKLLKSPIQFESPLILSDEKSASKIFGIDRKSKSKKPILHQSPSTKLEARRIPSWIKNADLEPILSPPPPTARKCQPKIESIEKSKELSKKIAALVIKSDSPTEMIAPDDYEHIFKNTLKGKMTNKIMRIASAIPTEMVAPIDYEHLFTNPLAVKKTLANKELIPRIPSDVPTEMVAPADYEHIFTNPFNAAKNPKTG